MSLEDNITEQLNSTNDDGQKTEEAQNNEQPEEQVLDAPSTEPSAESANKSLKKRKSTASEELEAFEGRTIEAPKKSKYGWLGYVLLAIAVGLGIWAMFGIAQDLGETQSLSSIIKGGSWKFALILLAVILVILSFDWLKYCVVMKTTTGKFNPRTSLKVQLLGKFYDNVTPFAVGGQPMQIYYLHKKGFSGGVSSAVILIKYFTQMFCMCTISLLFLAFNTGALNLIDSSGLDAGWRISLLVGAWIGITANMSMPVMVLLFVLLPKFARKLASFVVTIGYKLKIVKDKEKALANAEKTVNEFRTSFKIMSKKPLNFIVLILLCVVEALLRFALPYFVMKMFSVPFENDGLEAILSVIALNVYATQSVAIIPTPGNSGAIESTGTMAFSAFITGSILSWSVFVWRLSVYYIYIIVGLGIMIFDFIRKLVRSKKQQ